jgi:hypothetical protein
MAKFLFVLSLFLFPQLFAAEQFSAENLTTQQLAKKYGFETPEKLDVLREIVELHAEFKKIPSKMKIDQNGDITTEDELSEELQKRLEALQRYLDGLWHPKKWSYFLEELSSAKKEDVLFVSTLFSNSALTRAEQVENGMVVEIDYTNQLAFMLQYGSQARKVMKALTEKIDFSRLLQAKGYSPELAKRNGFRVEVEDSDIDNAFWVLSSSFLLNPEKVRESYQSLSAKDQEKWLYSNGIDGDSRLEPYDVLLARTRNQLESAALGGIGGLHIYESESSNMVRFGQLLDEYMNGFFDSTEKPPVVATVLRNDIFEASYTVVCMSPYSKFEYKINGAKHSFAKSGGLFQSTNVSYHHGNSSWHFSCGEKRFEIKEKPIAAGKIELPDTPEPKNNLKAVAALSLTSEMTTEMLDAGMVYLRLLGFTHFKVEETDELKKVFLEEAAKSDVIVPIGHSFSFGSIKIGTDRGTVVTARKTVGKSTVELTTLFPPADGGLSQDVYINAKDMGEILAGSDEHKTVFTMSCSSASSIDAWMLSYFKAKQDGMNVKAPFVFASNDGFETSNPFAILSHLDAPIYLLDNIAKGKPYEEIYLGLEKGFRRSIPGRISVLLGQSKDLVEGWSWAAFGYYIGTLMKPQIFHYEPVANFNSPLYTDGSQATAEIELYDGETGKLIGSY